MIIQAIALGRLSNYLSLTIESMPSQRLKVWNHQLQSFACAALAMVFVPRVQTTLPVTLPDRLALKQKCRPEARKVEGIVNAFAKRGSHTLADPLIP